MTNQPGVQVPSKLKAAPNRQTVPFEGSIDYSAARGFATITALAGINSVQQTIRVISPRTPLLTAPGPQYARFGEFLQFTVSGLQFFFIFVSLNQRRLKP